MCVHQTIIEYTCMCVSVCVTGCSWRGPLQKYTGSTAVGTKEEKKKNRSESHEPKDEED